MNNQVFIPSHGLSEIYLNIEDNCWYGHNSSCFDDQKEIPFFKLLHDMASLRIRYYFKLTTIALFFYKRYLILVELVYICLRALLKLEF